MQVSHETIYRTLFVQSRGALRKELTAHLPTKRVIRRPAGVRLPDGRGGRPGVHTRDYLENFEKIVASATDAAEAEAALLAAYPDAGLKIAASLGTKVATGEMTWG